MTANTTLKQTPLAQYHADYHAQMVEYAGWEMPIKYETSIKQEHEQTRNSGGIFDVSHMGRLSVKGKDAIRLLEHTCTRKIASMQEGQCRYGLICNEHGGVKDDVIVNRMGEQELLVVVNASNRDKIVEHLHSVIASRGFDVKLEDRTEKTAMIAIQGPKVMDMIGRVSSEIPTLKRYHFLVKNLMIAKVIVARTGYTGEDGVEVIMPSSMVKMAISMLMKELGDDEAHHLLKPCGLAARDTLRLEAGMPLYGHELGEDINALSCGIDFAIALDKCIETDTETFIGQGALLKTKGEGGPKTKLVGLEIDSKRTPRQGMPIMHNGNEVGIVTSGCTSPTLGKSIAMGFVPSSMTELGTGFEIDAGRATLPAVVIPLPFYKR